MKQVLKYPHELLEKAERLLREGQVSRISPVWYKVRGDHSAPTHPEGYDVEKLESGVWTCTCGGFRKRRICFCSHVLAVMMILERKNTDGA